MIGCSSINAGHAAFRSDAAIVGAYIASMLLVMAWLDFTINITLQENEEDASGVANPGRTAELIKALTLWLQYITLLGSVNISAPPSVSWIMTAASFSFTTVTSGALSTDCLQSGSTNTAMQRVLLHIAMPLIVLLLLTAVQALRWWWRPDPQAPLVTIPISSNPASSLSTSTSNAASGHTTVRAVHPAKSKLAELKRRLLVALLTVTFYYYPSYLTTALSLFECYHIDPTSQQLEQYYPENAQATARWGYWVPDMTVQCFQGWHTVLSLGLGIPLLLLVCVGIPSLPLALLYKHPQKLNTTAVQLRLGSIYTSYKSRFWFWESVVLVQTLALAAAQVFATSLDTYFQLTIMLMVLVMGITVLAHFQPFEEPLSQSMQVFGLFTVVATATGCLYFLDSNGVAKGGGLTAAGVLLLMLNIGFVSVMGMLISKRGGPAVVKWAVWLKQRVASLRTQVRQTCWPGTYRYRRGLNSTGSSCDASRSASVHLGLMSFISPRTTSQGLAG